VLPNETGDTLCLQCGLTNAAALGRATTNALATSVAGYEVLDELGRGAMGVVWLARDLALDRLVALKRVDSSIDPSFGARLLREGRAIAQLQHPHIVTIYALGETPSGAFFAMELLEGGDLQSRLQKQLPSPREVAELMVKIADALAHAHANNVLHRDIKPSNILLDAHDEPRLADFGLAAPLLGAGDLTVRGQVAGTPAFLAPELLQGVEHASPRSDIYGLGAVLYACLTGRAPFIGENSAAILAQIAHAEPPAPRLLNPAVPRDLETICLACLEKTPSRRYGSADDLRDDLRRFLDGEPIFARQIGPLEKAVRWCRRKPALAGSMGLAAVLLLVLAIGGPIVAWRMARARDAAETAHRSALAAEAKTREQLRDALLARSRATRLSGAQGQRFEALAAVEQAAKIRTGLDARDEAIAALTLPDLVQIREWPLAQKSRQAIAFAPDHNRYVIADDTSAVHLHRISDAVELGTFAGASRVSVGPTFSPDGHWLVARDDGARVVVWRDEQSAPVFVLHDRPYTLAGSVSGYGCPDAFSPDGQLLASATGHAVTLHATNDGHELRRIATSGEVTHVLFSPDGKRLALGAGRVTLGPFLAVHDVETGTELARPKLAHAYQTLEWSNNGRLLLLGSVLGGELFDAETGALLRQIVDAGYGEMAFGPPETLAGMNDGGAFKLWDRGTGRALLSASLGGEPDFAFDRSGTRVVKALLQSAREYQLEMPAVVRSVLQHNIHGFENVTHHGGSVLDYSRDGRWIATAVWGWVQLRSAATGEVVSLLPLGTGNNYCSVRFGANDDYLLVGSRELGFERVAIVHSADRIRLVKSNTIDAEKDFVLADLSPDRGLAVLVSMWRGEAKVVSIDGSTPTVRWQQPGAARAAFLSDGREVIVNSNYDIGHAPLVVRQASSGAELRTLIGQTHGYRVRVSPDGQSISLGGSRTLLRINGGEPASPLPEEIVGPEKMSAFSHDGAWLAGANGSRIFLVRVRNGEVVAHLEAPGSGTYVPDLAFSPDDTQLSVYFENGTLVQWDLRKLRSEVASRGLDW
jgi:WD40 repeat protein